MKLFYSDYVIYLIIEKNENLVVECLQEVDIGFV